MADTLFTVQKPTGMGHHSFHDVKPLLKQFEPRYGHPNLVRLASIMTALRLEGKTDLPDPHEVITPPSKG
jgi:hypothetical protein